MKGAALNAAMGIPRSSALQRSARVPPTRTIGPLNATPSMSRQTRSVPMFGATAQGMINITATSNVLAYTGLLPNVSLNGAAIC